MTFDATVNLGHLLTFAGFLAATLSGWYSVRSRVDILDERLQTLNTKTNSITSELKLQTEILVRLERQELEIGVLRTQLEEIRRIRHTN